MSTLQEALRQRFSGRRVTVVGLGREGTALVRFLAPLDALITVSDAQPADALSQQMGGIVGLPVRLALGGNDPADFLSADIVLLSPGVPLTLPAVVAARESGVELSSLTALFLEYCPVPLIGVTGSNGKTTTTSLIAAMLQAAGRWVWLGGNLGRPLIEQMERMLPGSWAVVELSSFQLELVQRSPHISVITNISPNHLDMHPTFEAYIAAKRNIFRFQTPFDVAVLNQDNSVTRDLMGQAPGRTLPFSRKVTLPGDGAFVRDDQAVMRYDGKERAIMPLGDLQIPGVHNVENLLAAAAAATAAGVPVEAQAAGARAFRGVEHRLERVREVAGVVYVNDSIATSPERALAGLRSYTRPLVLLAGGRDKHLSLEEWAAEARVRCRAVVLFGEAAAPFGRALAAAPGPRPEVRQAAGLAEAVALAQDIARSGDIVLLSPAGTSFDEFRDFEERGRRFKALVAALEERRAISA